MGIGEKFITKAQFEEWVRNLERRFFSTSNLNIHAVTPIVSKSFLELIDTPSSYEGYTTNLPFINSGATGIEFADNLFWDDTNKYFGIGVAPTEKLDVSGNIKALTIKLTNLTDGYIPYHINDATGLADSPIWTDGSKIGLFTSSPSVDIGIGGEADRTISMERRTTPASEGKGLFINAGGAKSGATDQPGGELRLSGGTGTGNRGSILSFYTAYVSPYEESGSGDQEPSLRGMIDEHGRFGWNTEFPSYYFQINHGPEPYIEGEEKHNSFGIIREGTGTSIALWIDDEGNSRIDSVFNNTWAADRTMVINYGQGGVGIGSLTPSSKLHVSHVIDEGGNLLTIENQSQADLLTKIIGLSFLGADTEAGQVEVANLSAIPEDSDWADSDLVIYVCHESNLIEIARLNNSGLNIDGILTINDVQIVSDRIIDARIDDAINESVWGATEAGVLDAVRDAMITHGLMAASA